MGIRIYRLLYAGVWLVFLAVPVTSAVTADVAVGLQALAVAATACFAVVYLGLFWHDVEGDETARDRRRFAGRMAVLVVLACLAVPAAGYTAVTYACFLTAALVFTLPLRSGLVAGVTAWVAACLLALPFAETPWPLFGTGLGVLFIVVIRLADHFEHRQLDAQEELRHAAQRDAIARDVHDVLGHSLTVLSIRAQLARRMIDLDPERAREEIDRIDSLARESLGQVRSTVARLRTPLLASELETAREALAAAGITADVDVHTVEDGEAELFAWALREAVTNVVRHSGASTCRVSVRPGMLRVEDDGVGTTEGTAFGAGSGLRGLRERAATAGARLTVSARSEDHERPGTVLEVGRA
ncbi:two-component system, NarL family, sensor histidine kinase DesK [Prauserella aidingensis]|uniref:sensor histidine kinase n=1 Tax=Prauserella aidingensis TaxID=387890 RepID=UPI0020A54009|nr:histidine kinase [Prauserella aidingensis]MCP2254538.1 two-component system, NarL family, sensor histidine kinase DesK [Prauserella aidingensis]